jgi:hypothetical protein
VQARAVVAAELRDLPVPQGLIEPYRERIRDGSLEPHNVVDARFVPLIAGPAADLPAPDFNLLVSTHPFALGRRIL